MLSPLIVREEVLGKVHDMPRKTVHDMFTNESDNRNTNAGDTEETR